MIGLGLRAQKGGAIVVAVAVHDGAPHVILSTLLATHAADDRLSLEPYRVAFEIARDQSGVPAEAVAAGRERQDRLADDGLRAIVARLGPGSTPVAAGLLVNRAGWVTDLLGYSLAFPEHAAVAEGLAVREALRFALRQSALPCVELDEKTLSGIAEGALGLSATEVEGQLKALGATVGKPWRKEQKLACLAGWVAAVSG